MKGSRRQSKEKDKGSRKILHSDERVDSRRRDNSSKCHAHSDRALQYMKQKLTKLEEKIIKFTIIVGDVNTPFSLINRPDR